MNEKTKLKGFYEQKKTSIYAKRKGFNKPHGTIEKNKKKTLQTSSFNEFKICKKIKLTNT